MKIMRVKNQWPERENDKAAFQSAVRYRAAKSKSSHRKAADGPGTLSIVRSILVPQSQVFAIGKDIRHLAHLSVSPSPSLAH